MRLFVAVDLPEDARIAIAAQQSRIAGRFPDARASLRFVRPEQLHLTLAFLGEVVPSLAGPIVDAMSLDLEMTPFRMTFGGLGVFPVHGRPRALFLGIVSGASQLIEVQQCVTRRLADAGVREEGRPFHPHLTLARWRDGHAGEARRIISDGPAEVARAEVSAVTLYQSRLSSTGPAYTALAKAPLTKC